MAHILEWRFVIGSLNLLHMHFQLLSARTNNCEVSVALFLEPKSSEKLAPVRNWLFVWVAALIRKTTVKSFGLIRTTM